MMVRLGAVHVGGGAIDRAGLLPFFRTTKSKLCGEMEVAA